MDKLSIRAKEIIQKILYITIASVTPDGQPWNSPVYSAFDENYNFYWNSWKENQHSQNIVNNNDIFLVIYDSTVAEGTGEGVYIKAKAYMVTEEKEIARALVLLQKRKNKPSSKLRNAQEFLGENPRRVYKAVPEKCWMNVDGDVNGMFIDKREEIHLK